MVFEDLDDETRTVMVDEVRSDIQRAALYLSPRLNSLGTRRWPVLLEEACWSGSPESLGSAVETESLLVSHETASRNGRSYTKRVPVNAASTLAEGEFVRFYMRAVCLRAVASLAKVQVYRAKVVANSRPESEMKVGSLVNPDALLSDLRQNVGINTVLGLPPGPNSGLCIRLVAL
ncbi:hypothetical protein [Micromonospora sp. 4G55]|uniref:hypothetical protein n=1 Tax=Micromonospora sp. 4G55 TaxID=2806102 RepID=UPI001A5AEBDD|nr:hypothetical protein [Micromonospora sp. 4G55]MBM0255568.1 hypothetical protein [Micromonospora sp. 4G55]